MKHATDYVAHIKALIILSAAVSSWTIVREEIQGDIGLLRYRLVLRDGSLLEMFERFEVTVGKHRVTKYSFHWQDAEGRLHKRWDNAAHYSQVSTHPHHVHDGAETKVLPHDPLDARAVLEIIERAIVD